MIDINIKGNAVPFKSPELKELFFDLLALYTASEVAKLIVESAGTDIFFAGAVANSIQRRLKKRT